MKITKSKLRQIIREELLREYDIGGMGLGFDPDDSLSANRLSPEDATRRAKTVVQILDPTALTTVADPEYREQVKQAGFAAFNPETTSAATVGLYLLTLAAAAPLVGKAIGISAKAARAALKGGAKSTKAVALADKAVKNASKQPQKVKSAVESAEESAKQVAKTSLVPQLKTGTKVDVHLFGKEGFRKTVIIGSIGDADDVVMVAPKAYARQPVTGQRMGKDVIRGGHLYRHFVEGVQSPHMPHEPPGGWVVVREVSAKPGKHIEVIADADYSANVYLIPETAFNQGSPKILAP